MPPPESSLLCQLLLCIVAAVYDNFLIVVLVYCYRCAQVSRNHNLAVIVLFGVVDFRLCAFQNSLYVSTITC